MTVLAVLLWLVVVWVPGALLLTALRPNASIASIVSTASALSLGVMFGWTTVLDALGVTVSPATVLPIVVGVPTAILVWARRAGTVPPVAGPRPGLGRAQTWTVAVVCAGSVALWWSVSHAATMAPANDDGSNHGFLTARIIALGSADPSRVFNDNVYSTATTHSYYPLAMHVAAALVSAATHASVASSLDVALIVTAGVVLPLGFAVLAARLFPTFPWAAPAAALLAVSFPAFPYYPAYWGGLPLIIGMALVAPVVDLLVGVIDEPGALRSGVLAGLALTGIFTLHNSELVTVLALTAILLTGDALRRGRPYLTAVLRRLLIAAAVLVLFMAPELGLLGVGATSRASVAHQPPVGLGTGLSDALLTFFAPSTLAGATTSVFLGQRSLAQMTVAWIGLLVLAGLVVGGVVASVRHHLRPEWAIGLAGTIALTVSSALHLPGANLLTLPWYTRWDRVVLNELFFFATFAGLGAAIAGARLARNRRELMAVATVALVAVPALPQLVDGYRFAAFAFNEASLAGPAEQAAFAYLKTHVPAGQRVLNDSVDGSAWMYAFDRVAPLTTAKAQDLPESGGQSYLQKHAAELSTDRRAQAAADLWRVTFAYIGPRVFPLRTSTLDPHALVMSPAWRLVYNVDGARIFERVVPAPRG